MEHNVKQPEIKLHYMDIEEEEGRVALVSAALLNYLPAISCTEHKNIYDNIVTHRNLAVKEQDDENLLNKVSCEGNVDEGLNYIKRSPAIICSMHTGSYRALNRMLIALEIPFALLTGNEVLEKEGDKLRTIYSRFSSNKNGELQLINAEQSNAGLQMLRTLKKGISLVVYLDGQTGAGLTTLENDNSCIIDFLHQQLIVRKGIAYLAHAAGVPIIPVTSYRKSKEDIRLLFYSVLFPDKLKARDDFAIATTQLLYNKFAKLIALYPEQWEGWLTLHKNVKLVNKLPVQKNKISQKGENLLFNETHFCTFRTGGLPFLFDKRQYLFYPVKEELHRLLRSCKEQPVVASSVNKKIRKTLLEMSVVLLL